MCNVNDVSLTIFYITLLYGLKQAWVVSSISGRNLAANFTRKAAVPTKFRKVT